MLPYCRILAPSVYIFFASVLPALAFGEQLARETEGQLTVVHVLISTAIAGVTQVCTGHAVVLAGSAKLQRPELCLSPALFTRCVPVCVLFIVRRLLWVDSPFSSLA